MAFSFISVNHRRSARVPAEGVLNYPCACHASNAAPEHTAGWTPRGGPRKKGPRGAPATCAHAFLQPCRTCSQLLQLCRGTGAIRRPWRLRQRPRPSQWRLQLPSGVFPHGLLLNAYSCRFAHRGWWREGWWGVPNNIPEM